MESDLFDTRVETTRVVEISGSRFHVVQIYCRLFVALNILTTGLVSFSYTKYVERHSMLFRRLSLDDSRSGWPIEGRVELYLSASRDTRRREAKRQVIKLISLKLIRTLIYSLIHV